MKYIILIYTLLLSGFTSAQTDIQIVKLKHEDKSVSVYAVNNSDIAYSVNVTIALEGMKVESPIKPAIKVLPGVDALVAVLIPTASKTHYKINFQASAIEKSKRVTIDKEVPDITIYTKNGQEKSTVLRLYLEKHEIPYNEINATYDKKSREIYENMLKRRNIEKSDARLPVVIIRGEAYHDITDMNSFIKKHF